MNWHAKQFTFGKPQVTLSWTSERHQGETDQSNGYTSESTLTSSDLEEDAPPQRRKKTKKHYSLVNFLDVFELEETNCQPVQAVLADMYNSLRSERGGLS